MSTTQTIDAALQMLADSGITIELAGGSIAAKPTALITSEIAATIRDHKPALVRLLRLADGLAPDEETQAYLDSIELVDPEPIGKEKLLAPVPEASKGNARDKAAAVVTKYPCSRCGAKLVRLAEAAEVDGRVNLSCRTPGCVGAKTVRAADAGGDQGGLFR